MNYRHGYHAGSFTDVFKHAVLVSLIQALTKKEGALCYFDTHAGAGCYDLFAEAPQKSLEFETGITKVFYENDTPSLLIPYLECVKQINERFSGGALSSLRYYPGSPSIMRHFLRPQDRLVLTELHPQEYALLKKEFAKTKQAAVHLLDGYHGLKAFLPPKERRGLILIDPPYEKPHELVEIPAMLSMALKRFATGVYAIWYPIKDRSIIERFYLSLKENIQSPILIAELSIFPDDNPMQLNGSGMAIINPPWQLDEQLLSYLPWLWQHLSVHHQGGFHVSFLK